MRNNCLNEILLQYLGQAEEIILFKLVCDMYETGDIGGVFRK